MDFNVFEFHSDLAAGLDSMGFRTPTPIQAETIPLIQASHDLIACAQTGTGKTAAYLLPLMDRICKMEERPPISALILAPTRELAVQIDQQVEGLAYFAGLSSIAIYGGGDGMGYEQQRRALREGVDIVIATPGRLIAHMSAGVVRFEGVRMLVLDEADRMLDMGFKDDINRIVRMLPEDRQTTMFSATMPPKIRDFAKTLLKNPKQVNIAISQPAEKIRQIKYRVGDDQKIELLKHILSNGEYKQIIVFSSTKEKVKSAYQELRKLNLKIKPFHSDLTQTEREELLLQFKNNQLPILIGTDVLSRGIDVDGIDLVVNFDVPPDPEDYIHRIGRTARAARTGTAITFVNARDARRFRSIEQLMDRVLAEQALPEGFKEVPPFEESVRSPKKKTNSRKPKKNKNKASVVVSERKEVAQESADSADAAPKPKNKRKNGFRRKRKSQSPDGNLTVSSPSTNASTGPNA